MAAVSYEAANSNRMELLHTLVAPHHSSHVAAAPNEGRASLTELAAVFNQHSAPDGSNPAAGYEELPKCQALPSDAATQHPTKVTESHQLQQRTHSAADRQQQDKQRQQQQQAGSNPEPLNHRSSSRRRKPKVSCSSAYGPGDYISSSVSIKAEDRDLGNNIIPEATVHRDHGTAVRSTSGKLDPAAATADNGGADPATAASATVYDVAAALFQQQQWDLSWASGHDAYYGHMEQQQQQKVAAAGRAAGANSRKRAGSSSTSGHAATAARGDAAAAVATAVYRVSGSGDLSDGTDHSGPMFDDQMIYDHMSHEGSTAAAAVGKGINGNKQERLKEKNRLAQRRFRARQKTMLEHMQIRMEQLAKQLDHRVKDLTLLHQENSYLKSLIQEQQKALMSAMVAQQQQQQQQQHGAQDPQRPAAAAAAHDHAGAAAGGGRNADQQYQQLQQMYEEHLRQQQQ